MVNTVGCSPALVRWQITWTTQSFSYPISVSQWLYCSLPSVPKKSSSDKYSNATERAEVGLVLKWMLFLCSLAMQKIWGSEEVVGLLTLHQPGLWCKEAEVTWNSVISHDNALWAPPNKCGKIMGSFSPLLTRKK